MSVAHDQRQPVLGHQFADRARRQRRRGGRERKIEQSRIHALANIGAIGFEAQIDARRLSANSTQDCRRKQHSGGVGRGDPEFTADCRGLEGRLAINPFKRVECGRERWSQGQRARRRRQTARHANQQRIADRLAQTLQGATHRRLAQPDILGGARDMAPPYQSLERGQKIEIDT